MSSTSSLFVLLMIAASGSVQVRGETTVPRRCERLKTTLTYSQEKAPRDISVVLPLIVEKVNRELEGVVDVEVLFTGGDIHRKVGEHSVQCSVARLISAVAPERIHADDEKGVDEHGREVITQCFHIPFNIVDTDECTLPVGHVMRHQCHEPARCVNTIGSYECLCPGKPENTVHVPAAADEQFWTRVEEQVRSPWELALPSSSASSCWGKASTHACCHQYGHSSEGATCRAKFRCPADPCMNTGLNDCASTAKCQTADSPLSNPTYSCVCPAGLMGNGHACRKGIDAKPRPMVKYDGVTPTEETVRNNFYCGCTRPVVDACAGFPKCEGKHEMCAVTADNKPMCVCKPGYVNIDPFGCVDETPPVIRLRHDPDGNGITRLQQGDTYKEHAVNIMDENAEDYLRSLKITYSRPLPPGCLTKIGAFHVNYTVATPWTSPPYIRVTRDVVIEDVDECSLDVHKYQAQCPQLIPQCDVEAGALCVNTIGSYTCMCPQYTSGDGFKPISTLSIDSQGKLQDAPVGYKGGTGCRDTTKPTIEILGPNPKILRTCKCNGLSGMMKAPKQKRDDDSNQSLINIQRESYEDDITHLIISTAGAELCATHTKGNPRATDCVRATDQTYKGSVDLSPRVGIGKPVQKSSLVWKVPYDVTDDAGNNATTVWRDIVVEEIDVIDVEKRIRDEVLADRERDVQEAVKLALEKERSKKDSTGVVLSTGNRGRKGRASCPPCPDCSCPKDGNVLTEHQCDLKCDKRMRLAGQICTPSEREVSLARKRSSFKNNTLLRGVLNFLEQVVSPSFAFLIFMCSATVVVLFVIYRVSAVVYSHRSGWSYWTSEDEVREQELLNSVTYHRSPVSGTRSQMNGASSTPGSLPPRVSMSIGATPNTGGRSMGNGLFSPMENRVIGDYRTELFSPRNSGEDNIYQNMSPITPSRTNGAPARNLQDIHSSGNSYNSRRRY